MPETQPKPARETIFFSRFPDARVKQAAMMVSIHPATIAADAWLVCRWLFNDDAETFEQCRPFIVKSLSEAMNHLPKQGEPIKVPAEFALVAWVLWDAKAVRS